MSDIVHYEVYVFQRNRWDLLTRYPEEQRTEAIDYAKEVEKTDKLPTKVVRETFDLNTQTFQEVLVFLSETPKPVTKRHTSYGGGSIPSFSSPQKKKKKGGGSIVEAMTMLSLSLIFAVVISGISTVTLLHAALSFEWMFSPVPQQFVFATFAFFFLLVSIPTASKWVNWDVFLFDSEPRKNQTKKQATHPEFQFSNQEIYGSEPVYEAETPSFVSYAIRKIFDFFDLLIGREPLSERLKKEEELQRKERAAFQTEPERTEENEPTESLPKEDEVNDEPENPDATDENEAEEKHNETAEHSNEIELPKELERFHLNMTMFLSVILRVLKNEKIQLNTFIRFGLELFLAGACEELSQANALSKDENRLILKKLLTLLGRTPTLADIFYFKMEEYTLEPKYLPMIKNGGKCMRLFSDNPTSPELITLIQNYFEEWSNPEQKEQISSGIITVMFTDMVSSTHLTQTMGDSFAQQIVRVHNSIVRKALKHFGGTEIKHTGDGIMASFVWASNAVDAAIEIQQAVAKRNNEEPTVPLEIRIGLNSGEPIVEDNDLFGSTVQMASRVCGQAGANQIYVSSVVKELSAGKKHTFKALGNFSLKGINEPQPLYEVVWEKPNLDQQQNPVQEREEGVVDFSATLPEF